MEVKVNKTLTQASYIKNIKGAKIWNVRAFTERFWKCFTLIKPCHSRDDKTPFGIKVDFNNLHRKPEW